jgi:cytochrome c6
VKRGEEMKRVPVSTLLVMAGLVSVAAPVAAEKSGAALFQEYCSSCHARGGNIINPQKTLFRIDREANGIRNPQDIVKKMRTPGPGMPRYGKNMISDRDALKIGEYVIGAFN